MKNTRSQDEIISLWKGDIEKPLVSICCITYNHEKYIKDAIEGFLSQRTDFPYEILIHDDASTDRTATLIKEYELLYPKVIKSIIQKENQYSKGVKISPTFLFPVAKGEFIALCEGDDFWISDNKISKQASLLINNANAAICFHPCLLVSEEKKIEGHELSKYAESIKFFDIDDVLRGGGSFMPTPSLFFRKKAIINLPQWFFDKAPVGDYYIQILCSLYGYAIYTPEVMSAYRVNAVGSWSLAQLKLDESKLIKQAENHEHCLTCISNDLSSKTAIDFAISLVYVNLSWHLMLNMSFKTSRFFLKKSIRHYSFINKRQIALSVFYPFLGGLRKLLLLIKFVKEKF